MTEAELQAGSPPPTARARMATLVRNFAVRGVIWRYYLDWALLNVPFYMQPVLLTFWTVFFYFFAAPARRAVVRNLAVVLPGSSAFMNHLRAFRTLLNFAWTISEASNYKVNNAEFDYEIVGSEHLAELAAGRGAIVLTAHMGSYDLGAALFAQKFNREIHMVRAPEPHRESAEHFHETVQQTGAGAIKINYNTAGALLSFDLLNALRRGEIVSIQGDRVIEGVASTEGELFNHPVLIPTGPFTLALVAEAPIYPLFIVRAGYRRYRVIVGEAIRVVRGERPRDQEIASAADKWCEVLESVIGQHWQQWFAFTPIFAVAAKR